MKTRSANVLRILILIAGVLVALILLLIVIGYALPIGHVATRDTRLAAPPERVFSTLRDVEKFPTWRSDVKTIEVLATTPALRWRERGDNDITFEMETVEAPTKLVTRIADKNAALRRFVDLRAFTAGRGHTAGDYRERRGLQPAVSIHVPVRVRAHGDH